MMISAAASAASGRCAAVAAAAAKRTASRRLLCRRAGAGGAGTDPPAAPTSVTAPAPAPPTCASAVSSPSASSFAARVRWMSSSSSSSSFSSSSASSFVPNSLREAVKTSVLEEASRPDSTLWSSSDGYDDDDRRSSGRGGGAAEQQRRETGGRGGRSVNGAASASASASASSWWTSSASGRESTTTTAATNGLNGSHLNGATGEGGGAPPPASSSFDIDDAISESRVLMLDDPLDEWHLDRTPRYFSSSSSSFDDTTSTTAPSTTAASASPSGTPAFVLAPGVRPVTDGADPFALARSDMETLASGIRRDLIGTDHPVLARAASYFFEDGQNQAGGKKVRPMMVLLMSRAMAVSAAGGTAAGTATTTAAGGTEATIIDPLPFQRSDLHRAQRRLAEISELIHTASLFHDDVIDGADTRRGVPTVHRAFGGFGGNKMAILAGDYLLARASIYLARLRDAEVVETMSAIIEHLVRGEVMQMRGAGGGEREADAAADAEEAAASETADARTEALASARLDHYLRKNFYKTASLMANSCKSAAILGNYPDAIVSASYRYGKHLGIAFQLVDDVLDFDGSATTMGKAPLSDINSGVVTGPVLFAARSYPQTLDPIIERKFRGEGDVNTAVEFVRKSDGIERTMDLARIHADLAVEAVLELGPSEYRDSLVHLARMVVDRVR